MTKYYNTILPGHKQSVYHSEDYMDYLDDNGDDIYDVVVERLREYFMSINADVGSNGDQQGDEGAGDESIHESDDGNKKGETVTAGVHEGNMSNHEESQWNEDDEYIVRELEQGNFKVLAPFMPPGPTLDF
jgi:hypothetical protein